MGGIDHMSPSVVNAKRAPAPGGALRIQGSLRKAAPAPPLSAMRRSAAGRFRDELRRVDARGLLVAGPRTLARAIYLPMPGLD
jgi:hypothetical protein